MTRLVTIAIILFTFVFILIWDIYAAITPEPGDTVSKVMKDLYNNHPTFAWITGVLCGHFCSGVDTSNLAISLSLLGIITLGIAYLDFMHRVPFNPIFVLIPGALAGYLCWGQA